MFNFKLARLCARQDAFIEGNTTKSFLFWRTLYHILDIGYRVRACQMFGHQEEVSHSSEYGRHVTVDCLRCGKTLSDGWF